MRSPCDLQGVSPEQFRKLRAEQYALRSCLGAIKETRKAECREWSWTHPPPGAARSLSNAPSIKERGFSGGYYLLKKHWSLWSRGRTINTSAMLPGSLGSLSLPWHWAEYWLEILSNHDIQENWWPGPRSARLQPVGSSLSPVSETPGHLQCKDRVKVRAGRVCRPQHLGFPGTSWRGGSAVFSEDRTLAASAWDL